MAVTHVAATQRLDALPTPDYTQCCIVGAGPAGAVLALLLARQGVEVTLLEAHTDFDRPFRGNTLSPAVMEVMREIGLVDQILALDHAKVPDFTVQTADGPFAFADFRRLHTPYPFVTMLPQVSFLDLIVAEARQYSVRVVLGARVEALIEDSGAIRGVRYRDAAGSHELRAPLTVGSDGRFSKLRRLAGITTVASSPPMDVLWFNLERRASDPHDAGAHFRFGPRSLLVLMDHVDCWQIGYIVAKGSYAAIKAAGLGAFRSSIAAIAPELADRVDQITDWQQVTVLSVESDRVRRWWRDGLLLIGDAAHTMSPVGGVGINCAIMDAVVAAELLAAPLKYGLISSNHLRAVQRRREWPTRIVQAAQNWTHRHVIARALAAPEPYRLPALLRLVLQLPFVAELPAALIAYNRWPRWRVCGGS